jgi:hypothetical protein
MALRAETGSKIRQAPAVETSRVDQLLAGSLGLLS